MAIAESETRNKYPLSRKKIIKKTLASTFGWVIMLAIIWGSAVGIIFALQSDTSIKVDLSSWFSWGIGLSSAVFVVLILLIFLLTYLYQVWYFNVYYYELEPDFIVIRKHPITPKEITIPYERVQDVYVDQDILDRIFGLYDVHLSSATISSGMEAHIDGVEKTAADGLRADILEKVRTKISKKPTDGSNQQ